MFPGAPMNRATANQKCPPITTRGSHFAITMDQDWSSVGWDKRGGRSNGQSRSAAVKQAHRSGTLQSEKRFAAGENRSAHSGGAGAGAHKLDNETEDFRHNRVDKNLSKAIQQARLAKKLNQKQLATMINEKPQIIGEYESGKAIPNGQIIVKLERALNARLPRPPKINKKKSSEN